MIPAKSSSEWGSREVVALCNNAGVGSFGRFQKLPFEGEARQMQLNVVALHELTGRLLPGMVARGRGAILNVGSIAGFQPQPIQSPPKRSGTPSRRRSTRT